MAKGNCEFNGGGRQYWILFVVHLFLFSMVTLGLYLPWAYVRLFRRRASHTLINGRPVTFDGTGGDLFLLGPLNGLLTILTFGIYWPWASCRIMKWKDQMPMSETRMATALLPSPKTPGKKRPSVDPISTQ